MAPKLQLQHLSSSAAESSVAALAVVLGASARLLVLLLLVLLLGVASNDRGLGLVYRSHGGGDGGKRRVVGRGRALSRARSLAGRLALGLGVVLLGALLVTGLLALRIALGGRGRSSGVGNRDSDNNRRGYHVHGVLLGALRLAGWLARGSALLLLITNDNGELLQGGLVHRGGSGGGNALRLTGRLAGRGTLLL
ncbi:hypothetical protein PENTCL1PPCAC_30569, partial [Pristionchus entomophagus]